MSRRRSTKAERSALAVIRAELEPHGFVCVLKPSGGKHTKIVATRGVRCTHHFSVGRTGSYEARVIEDYGRAWARKLLSSLA